MNEVQFGVLVTHGYMTQGWIDEAAEVVRSSPELKQAAKGIELSVMSILLNHPPEAFGFLYVEIKNGELTEYQVARTYEELTRNRPTPTFVVSGDFKVFEQIQRGDLGEKSALIRGKLHLTGGLAKALRFMRPLEAITNIVRQVEIASDEAGIAGVS